MVDQNEIDKNHLIIICTLDDQGNGIEYYALIDCGTTSFAFIDKIYAHYHHLPLHNLKLPKNLAVIDRGPITSGAIVHIVCICLTIYNHQENILLFITKLGHYPIVLGIL
jgi:hypothetical protein